LGKALTVLLVEDDQEDCNKFIKIVDSREDICLVGVTSSDTKALEYVTDHKPDAVILDLELLKGKGTGVMFLEELKKAQIKSPPYILVTTHNISRMTHEMVRREGADFIMVKSKDDYCVENVIEFLLLNKDVIHEVRRKNLSRDETTKESPFESRKRQEVRIATEIDLIGISPKAVGRGYLIDAIMNRIEGQSGQLTVIAKKYGKTEASVERAMQNAINRAWSTMQPDDLLALYTSRIHSEKGVPTVTEFVCHYTNKMKNEY